MQEPKIETFEWPSITLKFSLFLTCSKFKSEFLYDVMSYRFYQLNKCRCRCRCRCRCISPDSWCSFLITANSSKRNPGYYQGTLTTSVVISLLAPMAFEGNALSLAAIWRNPSLRTPSYVLLAGLAFTANSSQGC